MNILKSEDCYDVAKSCSSKLNDLQIKMDLYKANDASVPPALQEKYDCAFSDYIESAAVCFEHFFTPERIKSLEEYEKSLPEKVTFLIGPVSDIPRARLVQCMSVEAVFLNKFLESGLVDEECAANIDNLYIYMQHYCEKEYLKMDDFKRDSFDYTGYSLKWRDCSLENIILEVILNIKNLLSSSTDEDFYFYLELIESGMACYTANIPDSFYFG